MTNRILTVETSEELEAAVEMLAAGEGGTVRLAPGRYALNLRDDEGLTDAPVRLTSLDPSDPASFTSLRLQNRENVTVDHVVFDSVGIDRRPHHRDLELIGARDVEIADSVFRGAAAAALDGSSDDARATNLALVRNSDGVVIRDNHMSGYYHGIALLESDDVRILDNEITRLQGDGIRLGGVQDALIEGNHMHGMLGTSQDLNHSDMIQFWGTNIRQNNERVTIRENFINTSDGAAYQMIFGRNEHQSRNGFLFEDIVVEQNVLFGAHYNMISIAQTEGMVVRHNTVLWNRDSHGIKPGGGDDASNPGWIAAPGGRGAVIEGNLAAEVKGRAGENGIVNYADAGHADHYARHFVNLDAGETADLRDLRLRPGSEWDGALGAAATWSDAAVDALTATAAIGWTPGDRSLVTLDARLTRDEGGALGEGAEYVWTFEDGTERRGAVIEHDFATPGLHRYALLVRTADGRTDRIERKLEVTDPDLLALDLTDGRVRDDSSYGVGVTAEGGRLTDEGFVLDGSSAIDVSRGGTHLYSLDSFGLALDVTLEAGTDGTIVEMKKSLHGRIDAEGRFVFEIATTEGDFRLATAAGAVPRGERAEIGVVLDGPAGELRLLIDGEVEAATEIAGRTLPLEHWGLTLGNQFAGHSARGVLHGATLRGEPALEGDMRLVAGDGGSFDDGTPGGAGSEPDLARSGLLAEFDFDDGVADGSGRGTGAAWDADAVRFAAGSDGTGRAVALGDRDDGVVLGRANAHLFELDAFHVAFDLRRADLDAGGRILDLHKTLSLSTDADGRLALELTTDGGRAAIATASPLLTDAQWHAIELAYDDAEGRLELSVDGALAGSAALTGTTASASHWGLALGRLWGGEAPAWIDHLRIWDEARLRGGATAEDAGIAAHSVGSTGGDGAVLAAFAFEGDLTERDGRRVGVWAEDVPAFAEGRDGGEALRIGDGARVDVTRENAFLHDRDAFAFSFELRKDDAAGEGRVLQLHKSMLARVEDGELVFTLDTDEGSFTVATEGGALDDDGWHAVEIGYDDAADRLVLSVDGEAAETHASGATPEARHWGLTLGASWGDALEGAVDDFAMRAEPDWAL